MRRTAFAAALLGSAALFASLPVQAQTFRWANDGDVNSLDPYARNETFLLAFNASFYEPLVRRSAKMEVEPALAVSWEQTSPTVWRFKLRPGVKFQDGTPFSADDVIFSIERSRLPGSNLQSVWGSVKTIRKIDDLTVEFETAVPNPILLQEITGFGIMSKAWAEKNNAQKPADLTSKEENFATRNAMGTGPFRLVSREPDRKTVVERNAGWWDTPAGNVQRAELNIIANDATRVAALLSGEVDFVYTVPPQDVARIGSTPSVRIIQGPELRTIYLGMDQLRPELLKSDVKGKNPFQDERVRRAFYQAIDVNGIQRTVMRGQSKPTGLMWGPGVNGFVAADDTRLPLDLDAAKKLLAEAGYPNGFGVTLDCPNDRYVSDEAICTAVTSMLARIGVKVNLVAQTRARFFAEVNGPRYNTSFYLLGWTPTTGDAHNAIAQLIASRDGKARGVFNNGGVADARIDTLSDAIAVETDPAKRQAMMSEVGRIVRDKAYYIPLHQQQIVWAARSNIEVVQTADNFIQLRFVNVK
jgi:peptide/nickel transport system substrate-binding protein